MITEKGSIKVTTPMDEKMQKEIDKKTFIIGLVLVVICSLILVADILMFVLFKNKNIFSELIFSSIAAVFALLIGAYLLYRCKKLLRKVRFDGKVNEFEFFKNRAKSAIIVYGERKELEDFNYFEIFETKETQNYFHIYINRGQVIAILKEGLYDEELNALRGLFRLPLKGNVPPFELAILTEEK